MKGGTNISTAISELQAHDLVNSTREAPCTDEIAQLKRSEEGLAGQGEKLHVRAERRCLELVCSTAAAPHKHMKTLQQALMERRSNSGIRKPSPLVCHGRHNA